MGTVLLNPDSSGILGLDPPNDHLDRSRLILA